MYDIVHFSAEQSRFVEMTQCVWPERFSDIGGVVAHVSLVVSCHMRLILPSGLAMCNGRRYTAGWNIANSASSRCF